MSRPEFLPLPSTARTAAQTAGVGLRKPAGTGVAPLATGDPAPIPYPKGKGGKTEAEKIRAAAQQFEAVFISYLYKTMRATVPDSPFADDQSQSQGMYEDMFTQSLGTSLAGNGAPGQGLGLTEMLIKNLEPKAAHAMAGRLAQLQGEAAAASAAGQSSGATPAAAGGAPEVRRAVRALHSANIGSAGPKSPAGADFAAFAGAPADRLSVEKAQPTPRELPRLADNVREAIDQAADATGVDRHLLRAVALVESGGNPGAQSPRGARGLMQLMDGTARDLGVKNVFDPIENALAGARYLKRMLMNNGGNERLALASYNAGPGNVKRHGGVPPFPETLQYIQRVLDIRQKLGGGNA